MTNLHIISVGKQHDKRLHDMISEYEKRLTRHFTISWHLLASKDNTNTTEQISKESDEILKKIQPGAYVLLLDETGTQYDNHELSTQLQKTMSYKTVVIIIGGAYGVNERVKARADNTWSLSKLVFPHQIVRLLVVEQLYRSLMIAQGHPYHHE